LRRGGSRTGTGTGKNGGGKDDGWRFLPWGSASNVCRGKKTKQKVQCGGQQVGLGRGERGRFALLHAIRRGGFRRGALGKRIVLYPHTKNARRKAVKKKKAKKKQKTDCIGAGDSRWRVTNLFSIKNEFPRRAPGRGGE